MTALRSTESGATPATGTVAPPAPDAAPTASSRRSAFRAWRHNRPFVAGVLIVLAGIEMFFSSQLDLGNIQIQFGIEGLQATIIPLVTAILGVLIITMPQHRVFYGIIALALVLYALIGVNLGGFMIGTLLGAIGGVLAVAWMPGATRRRRGEKDAAAEHVSTLEPHDRIARVAEVMAYPVHLPVAAASTATLDAPAPPPFADAPRDGARRTTRSTAIAGRAAAVAILTVGALAASSLIGSTPAHAAEPASQGLCIPLLMDCSGGGGSTPTPTPTPTPTSTGGSGTGSGGSSSGGGLGGLLPGTGSGGGSTSTGDDSSTSGDDSTKQTGKWSLLGTESGTTYTLPAQKMTTQSLSFSGLEGLGLVKVPLAGGKTATVIKLAVDELTMTGYRLDIRRDADGPAAVETDNRIVLSGHVVVYLDSLTALGLTLATDTPPPTTEEFPDSVSGASFGLVGATADHMDRDGVHLDVQ